MLANKIYNKLKNRYSLTNIELKMILLAIQSLFNIQVLIFIEDQQNKDRYNLFCENIKPFKVPQNYTPELTIIIKRTKIQKNDGSRIFNYELLSYNGITVFDNNTLPTFMKRLKTNTCGN